MEERTPGQIQFDKMHDSVIDAATKCSPEMWINSEDKILVSLTVPTPFKVLLEDFAKIASKMTDESISAADIESSFFMDLILLGLRSHALREWTDNILEGMLKAMEEKVDEKTNKN